MSFYHSIIQRGLLILLCLLPVLPTVGCMPQRQTEPESTSNESSSNESSSMAPAPTEVSAWVAYWTMDDSIKDLEVIADRLTSLEVFAAYFNSQNKLFLPTKITQSLPTIKEQCKQTKALCYLTIVNDKENADGSSSLKDTDLLQTLLATVESRNAHIDDIIAITKAGDFNGVEIDYERVGRGMPEQFAQFCGELYTQLNGEALQLRVLLEPSFPTGKTKLPDGPEYVMMVYNLYGDHSGPGPKADVAFINETIQTMSNVPGKKHLAFAVGGYDWADGQKAVQLTDTQAIKLQEAQNVSPIRDKKSGALCFSYTDENGMGHTVWYSDEQTFLLWCQTAREAGYTNLALWKLGGCNPETLNSLMKMY